jgi:hypothetical protein
MFLRPLDSSHQYLQACKHVGFLETKLGNPKAIIFGGIYFPLNIKKSYLSYKGGTRCRLHHCDPKKEG